MGWKGIVREGVAHAVVASGLPAAVRRATRSRVTVAMYHDPTPEGFEAHLRFYRDRYAFVTYDAVVEALRGGDWSGVPERALAVTFDDGWAGNHRLLPLFRRYGVRPLIFACSAIVGSDRRYWFEEPVAVAALKRVSNRERLAALKRETGFEPLAPRPGPRLALSREEMLEMAPHVDFGSHTRTHPILTQCSDDEALDEIEGSRHELERLLGAPVRHFCSPNGDWGEREVELVRKAGYDSARTTDVGWVGPETDPYRIPVGATGDDVSVAMLATQLSGLPRYAKNAARGRFSGEWPRQPVARN